MKKFLLLTLLLPALANANVINISGAGDLNGSWETQLLFGPYYDFEETLVSQVWWQDRAAARIFAETLADGEAEGFNALLGVGPYFVWDFSGTTLNFVTYRNGGVAFGSTASSSSSFFETRDVTFATASRVTVPEPGTLVLLSLGLASIGIIRQRKF
ncbi:PEP-CTERM sorting domain-containing protein [Marinobacter flavimaris]|uniref:PEP-CTERM sorting domain-containing protein n=1 Tax=Marinobacter flavimaris TaxID=262076 RepID=A0A3D8H917_9GAMM|nr:PEP-CTERM sorting domain-containing protein [Marinobacter flavimaris]PPI78388.1 hypothetical protein MDHKLMBL_20285 [Marinobacter flavimaris]RDU42959.1 PEP-CTERM sorting domain-containing protein [Marinobacter flavimaris]